MFSTFVTQGPLYKIFYTYLASAERKCEMNKYKIENEKERKKIEEHKKYDAF